MLNIDTINCVRETILAEFLPRDGELRNAFQASLRRLAAKGLALSGNALVERGRIACDELTVRAQAIWTILQRCHGTFGASNVELANDLRQQIDEHLSAQAAVILDLSDLPANASLPPGVRTHVLDSVHTRRDQLIRKFHNEVRFYVQAISSVPPPASGNITIQGNVGALLTGANAIAHVYVDVSAAPRLIEAVEKLTAAIPRASDMSRERQIEALDVATDLIVAARATKPNGPKLAGLLGGVGTAIQTVASLRGAWELVRDAARAMGLPVP